MSASPHHEPWDLTDERRAEYRRTSAASREAKRAALRGEGPAPLHPVNLPQLDATDLMPYVGSHGLSALSLFSGGGGLDLGFNRAGYEHVASYEILTDAALTLAKAHPEWDVFGGDEGDVNGVPWRRLYRGGVDVLHGGPPCQPFSHAGRQRGGGDSRDMWPAMVRAVRAIRPAAFVAENVPALASAKFAEYVRTTIVEPLSASYTVTRFEVRAPDFGVPQVRRRVVFVGFRSRRAAARFEPPAPTHRLPGTDGKQPECAGARHALGLPDTGRDALAPTIRSGLTGPRHTTSVLSSVSAQRAWAKLGIWPNGVSPSREQARAFVPGNGHFRLSVPDVALLQGFPGWWEFQGATYMALGQIGNAVPPPMGYAVAGAVAAALHGRRTGQPAK